MSLWIYLGIMPWNQHKAYEICSMTKWCHGIGPSDTTEICQMQAEVPCKHVQRLQSAVCTFFEKVESQLFHDDFGKWMEMVSVSVDRCFQKQTAVTFGWVLHLTARISQRPSGHPKLLHLFCVIYQVNKIGRAHV